MTTVSVRPGCCHLLDDTRKFDEAFVALRVKHCVGIAEFAELPKGEGLKYSIIEVSTRAGHVGSPAVMMA